MPQHTTKKDANRVLKAVGLPPMKSQRGGARKKRPVRSRPPVYVMQHGDGFFGDVWKGIKTVGKGAVKGLGALGLKPSDVIGVIPDKRAQIGARGLKMIGLGHPKKRRTRRK